MTEVWNKTSYASKYIYITSKIKIQKNKLHRFTLFDFSGQCFVNYNNIKIHNVPSRHFKPCQVTSFFPNHLIMYAFSFFFEDLKMQYHYFILWTMVKESKHTNIEKWNGMNKLQIN